MANSKPATKKQARATDRFGLGPRPGERSAIDDPRGWLETQLKAGSDAVSTRFPKGQELPSAEHRRQLMEAQREARMANDQGPQRELFRKSRQVLDQEIEEVLAHRVRTDTPFVERLVAFWSNHLCVSTTAPPTLLWAGDYERRAIRPNILGRYSDLVLASARHPAMVFYLDNFRSIGPESRAARVAARRDRSIGLNENYARELLELHTVGVDGGYTQGDVEQLAQIFTGWTLGDSIAARRRPAFGSRQAGNSQMGPGTRGRRPAQDQRQNNGDFAFIAEVHQPGAKTVMGKRFADSGEDEGIAAIRHLCSLDQTARFVATKLARHFVSDDPPASSIETLAAVFRDTSGDLLQVSKALVNLDAAWDEDNRKFRSPQDWLIAVLRASGIKGFPQPAIRALRALRHTPWNPKAPIGYGDRLSDWADSASLMNRAELARSLASSPLKHQLSLERLSEIIELESNPETKLATLLADGEIERSERIALTLASPAFQWR